jgi:hypothetical protein
MQYSWRPPGVIIAQFFGILFAILLLEPFSPPVVTRLCRMGLPPRVARDVVTVKP